MPHILRRFAWAACLLAGVNLAPAFSLLGPYETWQVHETGYVLPGDFGGPRNIGQEFRRNTPVLYYSFHPTFLEFFGSNGIVEIDKAAAIMNAVTNLSSYSSDLSEFPLEARRYNYRARADGLLDLKSTTVGLLVEQLGLADAVRFTWTLHDRFVGAGGCPGDVIYLTTKRNFAINPSNLDSLQYSSYVNGVLYSYYINETCGTQQPAPEGEAVEITVDPYAFFFAPASTFSVTDNELGFFFTGLTRDDVAGMRYLMRYGNAQRESLGPGALGFFTNTAPNARAFLVSSNLALLEAQSLTNDAAALQALWPNLVVLSTSYDFTNIVTSNYISYFTNYPWSPYGTAPTNVIVPIYDTNVGYVYRHSFGNVITNLYYTNSWIGFLETNIGPPLYGIPGLIVTNVTLNNYRTNVPGGNVLIIPTNLCGAKIVSTQLVTVVQYTNLVTATTNAPGTTNADQREYSLSFVNYFTNYTIIYNPVECVTSNSDQVLRGIEGLRFERRDYDSLLGQFFEPVTNFYKLIVVTNNGNYTQQVQRLVSGRPDILFRAGDLQPGPNQNPNRIGAYVTRSVNFEPGPVAPGPGLVTSSNGVDITFNDSGPIYWNWATNNNFFLDEATASKDVLWGSFDDSTNAPVIYPNGTSIEGLENQMIMRITTANLPAATVGLYYDVLLEGSGGQPPYTWSLAPTSPGLPANLAVLSSGSVSGTPQSGTDGAYDIILRMTDAGGRFVERPFVLTIDP